MTSVQSAFAPLVFMQLPGTYFPQSGPATTPAQGDNFVPSQPVAVPPQPPSNISIVGAPTPEQYHLFMAELAKLLGLKIHESGAYYIKTDGSKGRYYPQPNLTFFAQGRTAENGDPLQDTTFALQSREGKLVADRLDERNKSLPHTLLVAALHSEHDIKLELNDNWTFRKQGENGATYYFQLDGSIYCSNGTTYKLNSDNSVRIQKDTKPLPFTLAFSQLGIPTYPISLLPVRIPKNVEVNIGSRKFNVFGAFRAPGDTGFYYIQGDGSIFYTGRVGQDSSVIDPYTMIRKDDKWAPSNLARMTPLSSTFYLASIGSYQHSDGTWALTLGDKNSLNDSLYVLPDGKLLKLAPSAGDLRVYVYENNIWKFIGNRTTNADKPHSDPDITKGIQTILTSRTDSKWSAISTSYLADLNATYLGDGTFRYAGSDKNAEGDSLYVLADGRILSISAYSDKLGVHIYGEVDGKRKWTPVADRTNNPLNLHSDPEIAKGIETIIMSRMDRQWFCKEEKRERALLFSAETRVSREQTVMPKLYFGRYGRCMLHYDPETHYGAGPHGPGIPKYSGSSFNLSDFSTLTNPKRNLDDLLLTGNKGQAKRLKLNDEEMLLIKRWIENGGK